VAGGKFNLLRLNPIQIKREVEGEEKEGGIERKVKMKRERERERRSGEGDREREGRSQS
jgi:hypothetical protein